MIILMCVDRCSVCVFVQVPMEALRVPLRFCLGDVPATLPDPFFLPVLVTFNFLALGFLVVVVEVTGGPKKVPNGSAPSFAVKEGVAEEANGLLVLSKVSKVD